MCNHNYLISYYNRPEQCYIAEQYSLAFNGVEILPIDSCGLCLFHSEDEAWKFANDFGKKLVTFADALTEIKKEWDFRGFVFVSQATDFVLIGLTTYRPINLGGATFKSNLKIEDCTFGDDVYAEKLIIQGGIELNGNSFVKNVSAGGGFEVFGLLFARETAFNEMLDLRGTKFHDQVNFTGVKIGGYANFSEAIFGKESTSTDYFQVNFDGFTSFENVRFCTEVVFEDCIFGNETEFKNTTFEKTCYFTLPSVRGNIHFEGTAERPIFSGLVEMELSPHLFNGGGQIQFKHANLTKLDAKTKQKLGSLKSARHVYLGEGTLLFRFTKQFRFPWSPLNRAILQNLMTSLSHYLEHCGDRPFLFELTREEEPDPLALTLHSDGEEDKDMFSDRLLKAANELIQNNHDEANELKKYISESFKHDLIESVKADLLTTFLQTLLGVRDSNIFIQNLQTERVTANQIDIVQVYNSEFYIERIENLNNLVNSLISDTEFQTFKLELTRLQTSQFEELKEILVQVRNQTLSGQTLKDFLLEHGISIGGNITASYLFEILKALI
jgi:hypothetical protein